MRLLALLFAVASLVLVTGCDSVTDTDPLSPPPELGTISGTVRLDADIQGTIAGAVVQLFTSYEDALVMRADRTVLVGESGNFEFRDVYAGVYYIGLWKDNDRNGQLSSGDFTVNRVSREQCACQVTAYCNTCVCPCIVVVP